MKVSNWRELRLTAAQRRLLIGLVTALSSQLYLSVWAEGFRVSASVILYPLLLVVMMRDSHRPDTGLVTGLSVMGIRVLIDLVRGVSLTTALVIEYPGGIFYLCYDVLLCILVRDRRAASLPRLWCSFFLCDLLSNTLNLALSSGLAGYPLPAEVIALSWVALARSCAAILILWAIGRYRQLLLREEHEHRYRHLFLMTAELKTELYFLKKDSEDVEAVMAHAYQLYEQLEAQQAPEALTSLALSIARDVHEVKKDNLRIIRGIESEVAGAYDGETMVLSDLLHILEVSTRQFLGSQRADIRLECRYSPDLPIGAHYRLLSILKNLVTNAVEAIQSAGGRGTIQVDCRAEGDQFLLQVRDDGPGIPERNRKLLFQVGYSTKFDPNTGDISRGVGLPAVQYIVEDLGGDIQVQSQPGQGACFQVSLPLAAVAGGTP